MSRSTTLALLACVLACSTVSESGSANHDDEAGEPELPLYGHEAPQLEPNGITFTALEFDQPYTRLAVGNVARGVSDPGCCIDYVLAGPSADDVRVPHVHRLVRLTIDAEQATQGLGDPVLTLYATTPRVILHPAAVDDSTLRLAWPALGMARWEQP